MSTRHLFTKTMVAWLLVGMPAMSMAAPNGAALYSEYCAACHGVDGRGGVGVPLALDEFLDSVTDSYLMNTVRLGRPGRVMPAFSDLSDAQLSAIVSHVRSFAPGSKRPPELTALIRGDVKHGKVLYASHCASCHGANGEGGKGTGVTFSRSRDLPIIAPALNNPGFLAAASDAAIKTALVNGRKGTPMPSFKELGLQEKDLDDIVSYVRSFETSVTAAQTKQVAEEPAVISMDSAYDFKKTIENVQAAAMAANYRIIRVQAFDEGLVDKKHENSKRTIIYFCNFKLLNEMLALDPRVGLFLPCRVTVVEQEGKVKVMAINPKRLSALFNNSELDKACEQMGMVYASILEEATL